MKKNQGHSQTEMFAHIKACKDSHQPQKAYCKNNNIAYSTFQYWSKKYRRENSKNEITDNSSGFIPVKVQPEPENAAQIRASEQLHFLLPNGVQVMCSDSISPEVLKNLLNP